MTPWTGHDQSPGYASEPVQQLSAPEPIRDADGYSTKPDPLAARTAAELVAALREYREWAGRPSFRRMAARSRQKVAHSTICTALRRDDELPKFNVVLAIVAGCGGGDRDLRAFATAHRRINLGKLDTPVAAIPPLRVVPRSTKANG